MNHRNIPLQGYSVTLTAQYIRQSLDADSFDFLDVNLISDHVVTGTSRASQCNARGEFIGTVYINADTGDGNNGD